MKQYIFLLNKLLNKTDTRTDRTGVGTKSVFGYQMRFDLNEGFPLVTTKKIFTKAIVHELLWMLSGSTNVKYLRDNGVTIWDEWADKNGNLGPVYGYQWRSWSDLRLEDSNGHPTYRNDTIDQIKNVIESLRENPDSRRHIVTAWNPADLPFQRLPPCHCLFQFYVEDGKLSCQLYQRSADVFLGVPFNIASYALLTHMIAQVCGLKVGEFIHTFGDVHLYLNHVEQAEIQVRRLPKPLPRLFLNQNISSIDDFKYEDISFIGYQFHEAIKADVAV